MFLTIKNLLKKSESNAFLYALLIVFIFAVQANGQPLGTIKSNIKIDQFGYMCSRQKIAVISNPQSGYNYPGEAFSPSTGANQYQVKRYSDNSTVFSGTITAWNGGATDYSYSTGTAPDYLQSRFGSGDKAWWFDFSSYTTSGTYYIYDAGNNVRSYQFEIRDDIYSDALEQATRMFYYQRCGAAKSTPSVAAAWADGACHKGALQDLNCRAFVSSGSGSSATEKDLSGGWHDAGDYNKYVNFAYRAVPDMLLAYEEEPTVWTDNFGIPESGNGVPDLLDEVKVELDWLLKMQAATGNGSVLCMIGVRPSSGANSPPSTDNYQRFYGPATTSASLSAAAMFALGAIQFNSIGNTAYGTTLTNAATNAWNWAVANPSVTWYNNGSLSAGEQELNGTQLLERKMAAAAYLYVLTGNAACKTYFESNYTSINWYNWPAASPNDGSIQDAMLYYTKASGATAAVKTNILNKYQSEIKTNNWQYPKYTAAKDPYRSYLKDWFWGSNEYKGRQGNMYLAMIEYNLDVANHSSYRDCASGYMHYMHGVNPTAFCYLSNMSSYGAENSINEFYSAWFADGSASWDRVGTSTYGPPPGFVPCGPNPSYTANTSLLPPYNQPAGKAYKDWNTVSDNSWEITENALYNNAPYIRMISKFVGAGGSCGVLPVTFSSLSARIVNSDKVELSWSTSSEKDNDYFVIEKSNNGFQFIAAGTVKGTGNSSLLNNYTFIDELSHHGVSYYRIKQIDTDGNSGYSEIRSINISSAHSSEEWSLYPNPSHEEIYLLAKSLHDLPYSIEVRDITGRIMIKRELIQENPFYLSITDLKEGIYFVNISGSGENSVLKLVKK